VKIGVFSDAITVPPKEGISLHVHELLRSFAHHSEHDIILFMCDRGMTDHELLRQEPYTTLLIPEHEFFSIDYIETLLKRYALDIAQTHKTYIAATVLGEACRRAHVPMVYEVHDIEKVVVPLYFPGDNRANEVEKHDKFQHQAANYASLVRVMSKYDYDKIVATWPEYNPNHYVWLPVAADAASDSFALSPQRSTISYIGNMSYGPNADGARALMDVSTKLTNYKWCMVGRGSEQFASEQIDARGMVEDIEPILRDTALGVAPIFSGSGMKIKNLMYLKHGIPVLTTTVGAQGYPDSAAIIIEDNLSQWPHIIHSLMADRAQLDRLSTEARRVFRNFESNYVNRQLATLYEQCIIGYRTQTDRLYTPVNQGDVDPREMYWIREHRESLTNCVAATTVLRARSQKLIVLEGLPGSGKSVLLSRLATIPHLRVVAEMVALIEESQALSYIDHDIKKYAAACCGKLTVMDRGIDSTLAVESHWSDSDAYRLSQEVVSTARSNGALYDPELIIYIDIPVATSLSRQNVWNSPLWRNKELLFSVKNYYERQYAGRKNVITIDGTQSIQSVYRDVIRALQQKGIIL
jgi:thymidylate kinase/glycosyltransferase involved in cell wall biosynthesis